MGSTSSPDPKTAPFESGMPRLVLQLVILSRGTLTWCGPLLTLPVGSASSLDPETAPSESGMPRLVLQLAVLSNPPLSWRPLFLPPLVGTSSPPHQTAPLMSCI